MLASSRGPRAAAGPRGRIWNPPLQTAARPEATGKRRSPRPWKTPVGADSISARFAVARGSAGGACPSPTNRGKRPTKRDGPDHPGNRRAGCPHPAGPAASHGPAERSRPFPTNGAGRAANRENHGPYGTTNLCRGRCLHRPGDPAAARTSAGGINPAPTNKFYVSGQPDGGGICAGS